MQRTNDFDPNGFHKHRFLGRLSLHSGTPPSQYILFNRVTDYYYYYPDGLRGFLPMRETLVVYLDTLGYDIIAIYNTSEGLLFADELHLTRARDTSMWERCKTIPLSTQPEEPSNNFRRTNRTPTVEERTTGSNTIQRPRQRGAAIQLLGDLLRQPNRSLGEAGFLRVAVIIERAQNIGIAGTSDADHQVIDQIQSWAGLTNGNVSFLIADMANQGMLPPALSGAHRSGVLPISVITPDHEEINRLLIRAEQGLVDRSFDGPQLRTAGTVTPHVRVNDAQRREIIARLEGSDIVTVRGYLLTCQRQAIDELNLRTLRSLISRSRDIWPELLNERELVRVEQRLRDTIRGQDHAIAQIIGRLRTVSHNLAEQVRTGIAERQLLAVFFFAGPTGVGKTEAFRVLTRTFPEIRSRQFNMPEYREEHSVSRFFGAPPGYIGYGRGELGDFLFENPAAIVLFDEFEKAHPNVWRNFLTMLEGGLTAGDGTRIDLSQAIFIFTSNAGADQLRPIEPYAQEHEQAAMRKHNEETVQWALRFAGAPSELIGRLLGSIVTFNHMTEEIIKEIIDTNLDKLSEQLGARFHTSIHESLLDLYVQRAKFGARPVKQHIDNLLKSQVLAHREPRGLMYRDLQNETQQTMLDEPPEPTYTRRERATSLTSNQPLLVDFSNPDQMRETASRAMAAVLVCDGQGRHIRTCSGVFINSEGFLLVPQRSIEGSQRLRCWSPFDQQVYELSLVAFSAYDRLAVLRPNHHLDQPRPFLLPANAGMVDSDTRVLALGFQDVRGQTPGDPDTYRATPQGQEGQITSRNESARIFIVDLPLPNASWAGGALLRCEDGELIGLLLNSGGASGETRALMSNALYQILSELELIQPIIRLDR